MTRLWGFISNNTEKLLLFVGGVIISAVLSSTLEGIISWSETSLILATIFIIITATYYFSETHHRISELTDKAQTTVYYVEELHREQEGIKYRGIPYVELARLVSNAKSEMLTLSSSFIDEGMRHITDSHPARLEYFATLEAKIIRMQESGFKYVRIPQVPREAENLPVRQYIAAETATHYRRIIHLERRIQNERVSLSILKVPAQRLTSFIVIDRQYISLVVYGVNSENRSYPAGMFVFEDRGGKMVERFVRYFENLERLAKPITLAELGTD